MLAHGRSPIDLFNAMVFVFRFRQADGVKLIFRDGMGPRLTANRPEDREFRSPKAQGGVDWLTVVQIGPLLEELDWRSLSSDQAGPIAVGRELSRTTSYLFTLGAQGGASTRP